MIEENDEQFWFCFPEAQSNTIAFYKKGLRWVRVKHSPPRVEVRGIGDSSDRCPGWSPGEIKPTEVVRILELAQKAWVKEREQLIRTLKEL